MPTVSPVDAVIFDLDGVLVDSEPLHFAALNRMLAASGHQLTEEQNRRFLGTTLEETMAGLVEMFELAGPPREYQARYDREVLRILRGPLEPAPGARQLLERLRAAGLKLALASSSQRAWVEATLASLNMTEFFPVVVCGDEVTRGKPDPEIFLRAAELLGVRPFQCMVIEDSPRGIAAAAAAGMRSIGVRTPFTASVHAGLAGANLVVDTLEQEEIVLLCLLR